MSRVSETDPCWQFYPLWVGSLPWTFGRFFSICFFFFVAAGRLGCKLTQSKGPVVDEGATLSLLPSDLACLPSSFAHDFGRFTFVMTAAERFVSSTHRLQNTPHVR